MKPEIELRVLAALGLLACVPQRCGACLSPAPCLVPPIQPVGPCLSPPLQDTALGPCLEAPVHPCLKPPPPLHPCLSVRPPDRPPEPKPKDGASLVPDLLDPAEVKARVLARGELPPDVIERLSRR